MAYDLSRRQETSPQGKGRPPVIKSVTAYEARRLAERMLRRGALTPQRERLLDVLAAMGVLLEEDLLHLINIRAGTLRAYRRLGLADLLTAPRDLAAKVAPRTPRVVALGPVGLALARMRYGRVPEGYLAVKGAQVTHDVLCNLVACAIATGAEQQGWAARLSGKYEATIHDESQRPVLEPDAMIALARGEERRLFVLEYHNEDFGARGAEKVARYEALFASGRWKSAWRTGIMPTVLVAWTHRAVGTAYQEAIVERQRVRQMGCTFAGRPLHSFLDRSAPRVWRRLGSDQAIDLLA